jgi:decaprenyl-phosphate phosphoribosyltransferase
MINEFLKLIRIKHWIKNIFVFVPIVFAHLLLDYHLLGKTVGMFFLFSFAASFLYVINDFHDRGKDRNHPVKKLRPIASGKISKSGVVRVEVVLFLLAYLLIVVFDFPLPAILIVGFYLLLNLAYTFFLKRIVIIDVMSIAIGYILRIYAGAFVINVPVSHWLIVTVLFLSFFLAAIKRRSEFLNQNDVITTRKVLTDYNIDLLNIMVIVSVTGVILSYILYTVSDKIYAALHTYNFVFSSIFVFYGLFRYLFLTFSNRKGEDPIELFMKDGSSLLNLFFYFVTVIFFIYY